MSRHDPGEAQVPAWAAPLTPTQYADAQRCAAEAPPLSGRQRAAIRSIFTAAAAASSSREQRAGGDAS